MKKLIIAITFALGVFGVRAENTGITTSQAYVETKAAEKQDVVPANNANSVMTYDSTSADGIGKKAIYNATESYSNQKDALMTADTANAAIQNAINNEFTCANPPKCTLWNMAGIFQQDNPTPHASGKNLFNINRSSVLYKSKPTIQVIKNSNGYTVSIPGEYTGYIAVRIEFGDISDFLGKHLVMSSKVTCSNGGQSIAFLGISNDDGTRAGALDTGGPVVERPGMTKMVFWLYILTGGTATDPSCTYYDIQIEEGTTATEYEPYQNLYIPQNVQ